jgi:hypothetical protein
LYVCLFVLSSFFIFAKVAISFLLKEHIFFRHLLPQKISK